jgi:hypothetical protein
MAVLLADRTLSKIAHWLRFVFSTANQRPLVICYANATRCLPSNVYIYASATFRDYAVLPRRLYSLCEH